MHHLGYGASHAVRWDFRMHHFPEYGYPCHDLRFVFADGYMSYIAMGCCHEKLLTVHTPLRMSLLLRPSISPLLCCAPIRGTEAR
ncbi:hypothetical protein PTI98_000372 [Pleurotus ostreatus]|nr:hypothetical protein PTI98_000372 [Pleurotus ostreatus]